MPLGRLNEQVSLSSLEKQKRGGRNKALDKKKKEQEEGWEMRLAPPAAPEPGGCARVNWDFGVFSVTKPPFDVSLFINSP